MRRIMAACFPIKPFSLTLQVFIPTFVRDPVLLEKVLRPILGSFKILQLQSSGFKDPQTFQSYSDGYPTMKKCITGECITPSSRMAISGCRRKFPR